MKLITRAELKEKLDRAENLKLVAVLGDWQFRTLHIPGSLNLPSTPDRYASSDALKGLSRDDEIVIYSSGEVCPESGSLYQLLVNRGYENVSRYAGGLLDWWSAGYPLAGEAAPRRPLSILC